MVEEGGGPRALTLRLLPTADAIHDEVMGMLRKDRAGQRLKEPSGGAYLSNMISERPVTVVRCLRSPYMQRWSEGLLDEMASVIVASCHGWDHASLVALPSAVILEVFGFGGEEERDTLAAIVRSGLEALHAELQRRKATSTANAGGLSFWLDEERVCGSGTGAARCRACFRVVGEASEGQTEQEVAAAAQLVEESARHWAALKLPAANGKCRTIVLADTRLCARHQTTYAQSQKVLEEGPDGLQEVPLLGAREEVLVLPLVDVVPSLASVPDRPEDESRYTEWNPWRTLLEEEAARSSAHEENCRRLVKAVWQATLPCPMRGKAVEGAAGAVLRLRRGGRDAEAARCELETHWDETSTEERVQLQHLALRTCDAAAQAWAAARQDEWEAPFQEAGNAWLAGHRPDDELLTAPTAKGWLHALAERAYGPCTSKLDSRVRVVVGPLPLTQSKKRPRRQEVPPRGERTRCLEPGEHLEDLRRQDVLADLKVLYDARSTPEAHVPKERRALVVAEEFYWHERASVEERLRFLWYGVVGTEKADDVLAWLRVMHERCWTELRRPGRCARRELQLCTVARFWASTCRAPPFRRGGYERRRDNVQLAALARWLSTLPAPQCAVVEERATVQQEWLESLRQEARYVAFLQREATERGSRRPVDTDTFGRAEAWNRHSTDDPAPLARFLRPSLEMLQRSFEEADRVVDRCLRESRLAQGGCRLLVAGGLARRLWVLLARHKEFAVLLCGQKDAPQAGGAATRLASLAVSRRSVYQLDEAGTARQLEAAGRQTANREGAARAIRLALHEETELHEADRSPPLLEGEAWWHKAQARSWRLCGAGVLRPEDWEDRALPVLAAHVARQDDAERSCRALLSAGESRISDGLEQQWRRRLVLTLRQAAAAACLALGDPVPIFLETFYEQLSRAAEEPLLQLLRACPAFDTVRKGRGERFAYSQALKNFAQCGLAPLCLGPATTLYVMHWVLAHPECLSALAELGADAEPWLRPLAALSRYEPPLDEGERLFLVQVAAFSELANSDFERQRQMAAGGVVQLRRRLLAAAHLRRALPGAFREVACALPLARGRRGSQLWSQLEVLALLPRTDPARLAEEMRASVGAALAGHRKPPEEAVLTSLGGASPLSAHAAEQHNKAALAQLELSEAVRCVRHFAEKTVRANWARWTQARRQQGWAVGGRTYLENLASGPPEDENFRSAPSAKLEYFLAACILHRRFEGHMGLAAMLEEAEAYAACCTPPLPGDEAVRVVAALRLLRRELVHHMHRVPGGALARADALQRRQQVEAFCHGKRDLFPDRPPPRGVLDGFGHRIWGESDDVRCWVAEGEAVRPWPRVRRILRADRLAEAWHTAWCAGQTRAYIARRRSNQHELDRADTELARDVLCNPGLRGLLTPEGRVRRVRLGWEPDSMRLGYAQLSFLEAKDPRGAESPPLGAHEIKQPILRRLVAEAAVPDVAWMACLLRADFVDASGGRTPSHLALAQCPRHKRALEPLTYAVELWPLFAARLRAEDLASDAALLAGLAREGSPVPVASRVAAHHALVGMDPREDYTVAGPTLLAQLAARRAALPAPWSPSPVWDELDLTGRTPKRRRDSPPLEAHVVQRPVAAEARLARFKELGEEAWFEAEGLHEHWSEHRRAVDWAAHKLGNRRHLHLLCRPCDYFYRHVWVAETMRLSKTPWCDAGHFPERLRLDHVPLSQPVVICPRTSGRRVQGGALPCGPFRREEYFRYVGDLGQCVLFGQDQQTLLRTLEERGLVFLAVNQDQFRTVKQVLAQACVLYLLGRWRYFPIFLGEGRTAFPWTGPRWTEGLRYLQQLVRQRLRAELAQPSVAAPLEALRAAWLEDGREAASLTLVAANLADLRAARSVSHPQAPALPEVPPLALEIEELQMRVARMHREKMGRETGCAPPSARVSPEELAGVLADRPPRRGDAPLLVFPTSEHMSGKCSTPLDEGGFLAPKDLRRWASLEALRTNQWPELGGEDPRLPPKASAPAKRQPLGHGEHIVVHPDWAHYMRGLSERLGRGPRDGGAPWGCRAVGARPPTDCPLRAVHDALQARSGGADLAGSREVVDILSRVFPETKGRWRGARRAERAEPAEPAEPAEFEAAEFEAAAPSEPAPGALRPSHYVLHAKEDVRAWLEEYPRHFEVRTLHDLRERRCFRGAAVCISQKQLRREQQRLAEGRPSPLTAGFGLERAQFLHGCRPPPNTATCSAEHAATFNGAQRALERGPTGSRDVLLAERDEFVQRTTQELAAARWPEGAGGAPGLHGARAAAAQDQEGEAVLVFVAGRAADFATEEQGAVRFTEHLCLALYPPEVHRPCYELTIASVRLMQRQLLRRFAMDTLLLVGVGQEAHDLFPDLERIIEAAPADALALPGGDDELPPASTPPGALWKLPPLSGVATLRQLQDEEGARELCAQCPVLRQHWARLRQRLAGPPRRKAAAPAKASAKRRRRQ